VKSANPRLFENTYLAKLMKNYLDDALPSMQCILMFHLLPPELRILVYEHCELFALTNLRSSCRILEREISAILFRTVDIELLRVRLQIVLL